MALESRVVRVNFPSTTGRDQTVNASASFSRTVRSAHLAVNGFELSFRNGDHELGLMRVNASDGTTISGTLVNFSVNVLLRDTSGNIDDPFGGFVDVLVLVETV